MWGTWALTRCLKDIEAKSSAIFRDEPDKPKSEWINLIEPNYYKPGLPMPIKMKIASLDSKEGLPNRNLSITILIRDKVLHQVHLLSDDFGLVQLVYDIPVEHLAARDKFENIEIKVRRLNLTQKPKQHG